jgi:hypothetical protein
MIKMKNKVLAKQLRQLENDVNVTVNNIKTERELEDMLYQTEKAIRYVFDEQRVGADKYFALLDVINAVDKHSLMNLRNNFFDGPIDNPLMRLKLSVLLLAISRKLLLKNDFLSNFAV